MCYVYFAFIQQSGGNNAEPACWKARTQVPLSKMLWKQTKPTTYTAPSLTNANKRRFKRSVCAAFYGEGVACYLQHFISRNSFVSFSLQTINSFSAVKTAIFKATFYVREAIIVKGMQHCAETAFRNLAHRKIQHLSVIFDFSHKIRITVLRLHAIYR